MKFIHTSVEKAERVYRNRCHRDAAREFRRWNCTPDSHVGAWAQPEFRLRLKKLHSGKRP